MNQNRPVNPLTFVIAASLLSLCAAYADPSCNVYPNPQAKRSLIRSGIGAFTYDDASRTGPSHWGRINCPGYYKCKTGKLQSPINIKRLRSWTPPCRLNLKLYTKGDVRMEYRYAPNDFTFRCREKYRVCGSINYRGDSYNLLQLHMHSPSEHTIEGERFPMEMHFVHQSTDRSLAVLGVFVKIGAHNPDFEQLLKAARNKSWRSVNLRRMLKRVAWKPRPCTFVGSLTTPPCTEGIKWIVSSTPIFASKWQIEAFRAMTGHHSNNRPLQSSLGRSIRCFWDDKQQNNPNLPLCGKEHY